MLHNLINEEIVFDYVNYKGEKSRRNAMIYGVLYGHNEWHKEDQFLLEGHDVGKQAYRTYAIKDMSNIVVITEENV